MTNGSIKNGTILSQSTRQVGLGLRDSQLGEAQPETGQPAPVASGESILASGASIPRYNNNRKKEYLLHGATIIKKTEAGALREILAAFAPIMESRVRQEIFLWFLENSAGISNQLKNELNSDQANVHRELNWLKEHGFIETYGPIRVFKKPGPKPILYTLPGTPKESIPKMILRAQESYTKIYKVAQDLTQRIFDDIRDEEIQYMKIVNLAKKNSQGFYFLDVAEIVARELHSQGIKVWR